MLSNKLNNDKVLKVFSSIRCLNKDQLPRYIGGRLTDIEKHLVEQHLADCDLCYGALQALEKEDGQEKYQDLTYKLQRFVRDSIQPVSHVQKVAQYTRKEKTKEHLLFYFWVFAFIGLGIGSVYVLRGHIRNQPPPPVRYVAAVTPAPQETPPDNNTPAPATNTQVVAPVNTSQPSAVQLPPTAATATTPAPATTTPAVDSAAIKRAAALKAQQRKAAADSIARVKQAQLLQKQQDSIRRENEKAKEAEPKKVEEEKKPAPKQEQAPVKQATPEPEKKETPPPTATDSDEYLYKAAMAFQQQGNYNEAISRYKKLESVSSGRYVELARYQMAVCYKNKGQSGKARRMFKEVIRMDGSMKNSAQQALDGM